MTLPDLTIYLDDIAEREQYMRDLTAVHLSVNYDTDRAHGVYEDAPEGLQGEPK